MGRLLERRGRICRLELLCSLDVTLSFVHMLCAAWRSSRLFSTRHVLVSAHVRTRAEAHPLDSSYRGMKGHVSIYIHFG